MVNDLKNTGLDNSKLLLSITEKNETIELLTSERDRIKDEFQKYKEEYPLKVGKIGGKLVNADTIRELERKIQELEQELEKAKQ